MKKDDFLKGFYEQRIDVAMDIYMESCGKYKEAEQEANAELENLAEFGFTKEQRIKVDRVATAFNHFGSVYGEEAYKFGFWDGVRLMLLLHRPERR